MNFLKKLFKSKNVDPVFETYKDHRIVDAPMPEGPKFRMSARIELDVNGETKAHHLIRADTFNDAQSASAAAFVKAKQVIDEQGKHLFR